MAIAGECICGRHFLDCQLERNANCSFCGRNLREAAAGRSQLERNRLYALLNLNSQRQVVHDAAKKWVENYERGSAILREFGVLEDMEEKVRRAESDLWWAEKMAQWEARERTFKGTVKALLNFLK